MANLLRDPVRRNNQGYNSFPMHQWNYFTCSCGQIVPFFYDFLQPGDHVTIGTDMYNRMTTLLSSSPVEIVNHCQYFFVPLRYLYSVMPSMLTAVDDIKTSFVDKTQLNKRIPFIDLVKYLKNSMTSGSGTSVNDIVPSQFGDMMGDIAPKGTRRLMQGLGYGDFYRYSKDYSGQYWGATNWNNPIVVNPFLACAYQLIYQDYFRIDEREDMHAEWFNLDKYYNNPDILSVENAEWSIRSTQGMFGLRYVPWKKDYFTNVDVSPLTSAGSHSILSSESNDTFNFVKQWLSDEIPVSGANTPQKIADNTGNSSPNNGSNVLFSFNNSTGTQGHRMASVIERFASIVGHADKNYRDQIQSLYGFTPPRFTSNMCERIGYDSMKLNIYEVVSDATTGLPTDAGASQLGDIAGKSASYSRGKSHKFTAPEHGILLAVAFSVPNAIYGCNALDRINTYLERTDFPNPLFDRLGQEPLFSEQIDLYPDPYFNNTSLGWQYRHSELKMKYDRAFGAFAGSLKYWIPTRDQQAFDQFQSSNLHPWYVSPWYLNDILLTPYMQPDETNGNPLAYWKVYSDSPNPHYSQSLLWDEHLFDSDPFMNFYKVNYVKTSKMDVYGLPKNMS